MGLAAKKFSSS